MKRILATATAATFLALLFTNCKKENHPLTTTDNTLESIGYLEENTEVVYREDAKNINNQSRPGTDITDPLPSLAIDIRNLSCFAGGETVEVYAIGFEKDFLTTGRFAIEWNVDGERMGNAPRLECIVGKQAEATVTFLPTGQKFRAKTRLATNVAGIDR